MLTDKDLRKYRQLIEQAVVEIGRDDVGVGEVEDTGDGHLSVTFSRGELTHIASIPTDRLGEAEQAKEAVNRAILGLSKRIAQEAIKKA